MLLGLHASVRRGFLPALEEALALGCRALQILPYARHREPTPEELAAFREARRASTVSALLVHSRFVPSLASSDPERRERSVRHLARELSLCAALGGDAFVLHAGAYSPDCDLDAGVRLFAESAWKAVSTAGWRGTLLLENVPGGGRRMGGRLEELARLQDALGPRVPGLGACLDTAHAYAAGYDLSSAEGTLKFLARAHRLLGFDSVRAFHLNDTRALLGSNLESHWHWGRGRLGAEALRTLLSREEFAETPAILETPKDGPEADRENLAFAARLA
jgi:deoxyribonuclease IV